MTDWINTEEDNPKPDLDRAFLITDGNTVSLGVFESLGEADWIDIGDQKSSMFYFRGTLGKITHWSSLPLPPEDDES